MKSSYEIAMIQGVSSMQNSDGMREYMKDHGGEVDFHNVCTLFYMGFIEGKRQERSRKKRQGA